MPVLRRSSIPFLVSILFLLCRGVAFAADPAPDPLAAARAHYHAGHYDDAVAETKKVGTAAAHAFAAHALVAKAISQLPFDQRLPVLRIADAEADAAIAADGKLFDGHLQKVMVFSEMERFKGDLGGALKGAAGKSRAMIQQALDIEPNNPWALAALGGWNLEIARRAPIGMGKILFGASRAQGIDAFERALRADPNNSLIRYEFGMSLLSLDPKQNRARAEELLNAARVIPSEDAFTRFVQKRADHLLALLAAGDHDKLNTTLTVYRGEVPAPT